MASGSKLNSLDDIAPANDHEGTDETAFTSTTYTTGANVCGISFIAPTSGSVTVWWSARFQVNTAARWVGVTVEVKTGSTLGSGTVVSAGADNSCLESSQTTGAGGDSRTQAAMYRKVDGLTAGSTYNVVTQHRVINGVGNGDIYERDVMVVSNAA